MKFLDPMATFQYIGGALPIHIVLAIQSYITVTENIHCIVKIPKYNILDQRMMFWVHILIIFNTMVRRSIHLCTKKRYSFIKVNLNLIATFLYLLCITFTWFKVFNWDTQAITLESECEANVCCAAPESRDCSSFVGYQEIFCTYIQNLDLKERSKF